MNYCPTDRLRLAVVDAGLPNPEFDAGSRAILDFIDTVLETPEHKISELHFVAMGSNPWGRDKDLRERGIHIHAPDAALLSPPNQLNWLDRVSPDVVVISRPGPASQWLTTVTTYAQSGVSQRPRFFYFGHDISFQRLAQQQQFVPRMGLDRQQRLHEVLEPIIWEHFCGVFYGSKTECAHVNSRFPNKATYMPLYRAPKSFDVAPILNRRTGSVPMVLLVGGSHHAPNRDALSFLMAEVLPHVRNSIELDIVGDWPHSVRQLAQYQPHHKQHRIHWCGRLSATDLDRAYQDCTFAIAPLRFGAGVKGKVFEAITKQCPVLTTPVGAQGFEHLAWPALCRSEARPEDVASHIKQLLAISPKQQFAHELNQMKQELARDNEMAVNSWKHVLCVH